jgi:hypothetical protein
MSHEQIIDEFHERIGHDYAPKLLKHTVPIYRLAKNSQGEDLLQRDKSGIFLRIGNDYFIVTASHHLHTHIENNSHLFLGDSSVNEDPVTVIGVDFH